MGSDRSEEGFPEAVTKLRWFRGTYLDQVVVFEGVLDAYLFDYLQPPADFRVVFYGTILQRLTLQQKVDTMCDFIEHSGLREDFPELPKRLRDVVTFRNQCAHAHIQASQTAAGTWTSATATVREWRHGALRQRTIKEKQFEVHLRAVPAVLDELQSFGSRVATIRAQAEGSSGA
jgi:hypothetical protein